MVSILVVDDSLTDRRLVCSLLQQSLDCSLVEADSAETALEQLDARDIDLVLTDLQMPGLNGLELLGRIRENQPSLPVILMTSKGSEGIAAQALKTGATSYVPKIHLVPDLVPTVQRIIAGAQQEGRHSRLMHNLTSGELTFELRNDVTLIAPLVRLFQEMLRCLPLSDEAERLRVGVAVEEAIKNAIYHGNLEVGSAFETGRPQDDLLAERLWATPYCNRTVTVTVNISHEEAHFVIHDDGLGFDPPFVHDEFDSDSKGGRGIRLMQTFMDDVKYSDDGRQVSLHKYRYHSDEAEGS